MRASPILYHPYGVLDSVAHLLCFVCVCERIWQFFKTSDKAVSAAADLILFVNKSTKMLSISSRTETGLPTPQGLKRLSQAHNFVDGVSSSPPFVQSPYLCNRGSVTILLAICVHPNHAYTCHVLKTKHEAIAHSIMKYCCRLVLEFMRT